MREPELPDYVLSNRTYWDSEAASYADAGDRLWAAAEQRWGVFGVPETTLAVMPDVSGMDVVELGCGTAYRLAWLARRGAKVTGIDNSPKQLETARRLQVEYNLEFPLHLGNAETTPFADDSFDLAVSEYGASLWADPYRWIPEAARILRPGGQLIFLTNGTFYILAVPDEEDVPPTDRLLRPYFGMHRFDWPDTPGIEFHLGYGDWIRLLRKNDFEVEDLIEVRPAEDATTRWRAVTLDWARRWPCEEIWKARLRR